MYKKLISVAICTYNGEKYIAQQLNSILNQELPVYEIVIGDDCSTDRTIEIVKTILEDSSAKYNIIQNTEQLGVELNFENVINNCSGDYIFTSDQDDVWESNKTKLLCKALEEENTVMAFSDAVIIDSESNVIRTSLMVKDGFIFNNTNQEFMDCILRLGFTTYGCTMAFRRDFVTEIMPFYLSTANHDAWIMCCAGFFGKVAYIKKPLVRYRIHGQNIAGSLNGRKEWENIIKKQDEFDRHFAIHENRLLRVSLVKNALERWPNIHNDYSKECNSLVHYIETITQLKEDSKTTRIKKIIHLYIKGYYHFRIIDRNRTISKQLLFKQFIRDIHYLLSSESASNSSAH